MGVTKDYFVHESAYVDEPCQIGKATKIWHFCHVMKNARIGENCILGQNVLVASGKFSTSRDMLTCTLYLLH